jgi:hypothetical protein
VDEAALAREVEQIAFARDALAIPHVQFRLPERRRHLVLYHLHPRPAAGGLVAVFNLADAPHITADRRLNGKISLFHSSTPLNLDIYNG